MKTTILAFGLFFAAAPAFAFEADFTGTVSMGLFGASSGGESGITPYLGVDAEATVTFELGDALTVGIIIPLNGEIMDDSFLPAHR